MSPRFCRTHLKLSRRNEKMNENILLTIAIPTYNRVKFLGRAMDSVLSQMTDGVELLISDNASQDGTEALVEEKMREYPSIRYIRNPENIGPDANFLQCMKEAKGKFILLLGSDDIAVDGMMKELLLFLREHGDCDLLFLNFVMFSGEYKGVQCCSKPFLDEKNISITTTDKDLFVKNCKNKFTFMSALVIPKRGFLSVKNPERYLNTNFIHMYIAMEAASAPEAKLGIVQSICIAQDATLGNSGTDKNPSKMFQIFGERMERVFCSFSKEIGFAPATMKKVYLQYFRYAAPRMIIRMKAQRVVDWKKNFKEYAYPLLKRHALLFLTVMPFYYVPSFIARWLYEKFRPFYKKKKGQV